MAAPLIGTLVRRSPDSLDARISSDNARRATNLDAALKAFAGPARKADAPAPGCRSSSGIGQFIAGFYSEVPAGPATVRKAEPGPFHPRVKAVADRLPPDAGRLLELIVRADEACRGAELIDVSLHAVTSALGVTSEKAEAARNSLERAGLISFYDNGSGDRGFRPTV